MLTKVLVAIAVIVVVLVVVVALQPSEFRVARSATISAPPAAVFAQVNDFHRWEAWNPWGKIDPAMKQTYEGAPAGTGAVYAWSGNNEVGEGRMTITESRPSDLIRIKLEFFKPFEGTSTAEFTFKPEGESNRRDVEHGRRQKFHGQGDSPVHEHGQNDRRSIREGTGGHEIGLWKQRPSNSAATFIRPRDGKLRALIYPRGVSAAGPGGPKFPNRMSLTNSSFVSG